MSHIVTLSHLLMTRHRYLQGHQSHRVQSYSRDKTDWTVQSSKLSYSRENSADIGLKFPLNKNIDKKYSNIVTGGKIRKEILETMANVCAFSVSILSRKKIVTRWQGGKMPLHCSLDQITPFSNKFTFLMYSMNQYTHSVSRVCTPTAWIFKKLSKSKPEPVRVQWGYCLRGVRVLETPLYDYWPDRRLKNLIVMPSLPYCPHSPNFLSFSQISSRCHNRGTFWQLYHKIADCMRDIQYIPRNMHTVFALLCFVVVIHWLIFPYPSGLLHWHCGNLTIAPVPAKQPWWIWINTSCEFIMNDCITTTKQSTTKPCAYFLGYTVTGYYTAYWLAIANCQWSTVYPKKYAHGFVVLCFVVVMQSFIMNSHKVFIHIHQGCFAGTGAIVRLPQCQWSKPGGYGKISQCITTTKHNKAKTVCIFLGVYCMLACVYLGKGTLNYVSVSTCWIDMPIVVKDYPWWELCHMNYLNWVFL